MLNSSASVPGLLSRLFFPFPRRLFSSSCAKLRRVLDAPLSPPVGSSPLLPLSNSTREALGRMAADGNRFYAKVLLKSHSFTVTKGDTILTHRLPEVSLGDVLRLTRVYEFGSANYTLRGNPCIDARYFVVRAVVVEHARGQKVKAKEGKQRKGRRKKVTIKPHTTRLSVLDVSLDKSQL